MSHGQLVHIAFASRISSPRPIRTEPLTTSPATRGWNRESMAASIPTLPVITFESEREGACSKVTTRSDEASNGRQEKLKIPSPPHHMLLCFSPGPRMARRRLIRARPATISHPRLRYKQECWVETSLEASSKRILAAGQEPACLLVSGSTSQPGGTSARELQVLGLALDASAGDGAQSQGDGQDRAEGHSGLDSPAENRTRKQGQ